MKIIQEIYQMPPGIMYFACFYDEKKDEIKLDRCLYMAKTISVTIEDKDIYNTLFVPVHFTKGQLDIPSNCDNFLGYLNYTEKQRFDTSHEALREYFKDKLEKYKK